MQSAMMKPPSLLPTFLPVVELFLNAVRLVVARHDAVEGPDTAIVIGREQL